MAETWTVLKLLKWTAEYFAGKGIDNGRLDAELLLAATLGLNRVGLYLNYDRPLSAEELTLFRQQVERRARREPLAYILGRCEFWSLPFAVTPAVLIPRPDTEVLVEEALKRLPQNGQVLDVGLGSGAIAVAIAHERSDARIEGIDLSLSALAVAQGNAAANAVAAQVSFHQGDLFALNGGPYDVIVSNPPYIAAAEMPTLMPEVRDFEPSLALVAGADGLDCYRALVPAAWSQLCAGGWLLVEVGAGQAPAVREFFATTGYSECFTARDLAGIERVVGGRKP
ncbi:MAG TPA: peptide chain release factor N(5)-glutamine methyltransferase [Desulfuromonas sp.]|nr:peptide chain release factor N(5)-glutamine methyltransferase [Desulfuromonas sp.]